jgi:hypothetical protein
LFSECATAARRLAGCHALPLFAVQQSALFLFANRHHPYGVAVAMRLATGEKK